MRRRQVLVGTALSLSGASAGCLSRDRPLGLPGEEEEPLVEIIEDRLVRENPGTEEEAVRVEGIAENVSDRQLTYVEIQARFFDEDDELLDSTVEHINDVTAGRRWEFEIEFPRTGDAAERVVGYELEVVTNI
ncbi:FxLYD domain-containing protein [Natronocalculus amylovorans]|uniref:FxLYD domain-containing protein n=1 Tax=Natronocalculus amylovorans TaxID=2917812 RepID=A0AAE3FUS4_9EURY|nr:FxLYD domain-containing protein [Natronocalculus amylovorans]MCL9815556.1 FxLYD domain-containing protein [Natronocalculus amylovorans]